MARRVVRTDRAPSYKGFSQGVEVTTPGRIIYTAGQMAVDENGQTVGLGDFDAQARKTIENIEAVLTAAGATLQDVTKVTCYFTDIRYLLRFNEIRNELFGDEAPASTAIQVAALARPGVLLEVEAVAYVSSGEG